MSGGGPLPLYLLLLVVPLLATTAAVAVGCFSAKKQPKKAPQTAEPTPPQGLPLGGSGERDDDTLKNVPSLQKDLLNKRKPE